MLAVPRFQNNGAEAALPDLSFEVAQNAPCHPAPPGSRSDKHALDLGAVGASWAEGTTTEHRLAFLGYDKETSRELKIIDFNAIDRTSRIKHGDLSVQFTDQCAGFRSRGAYTDDRHFIPFKPLNLQRDKSR